MPVRRNIATNAAARQSYVRGAIALKNEFTGVTTQMLGIPGPSRQVSTWDRFVAWHSAAMGIAHRGPLFLPWHRLMLRTLEILLARALNDPDFGLPYWDWAADGQLTRPQQLAAAIWNNNCMGSASVAPGPFTLAAFPIRLADGGSGNIVQANRALRRARGSGVPQIPNPNLPRRVSTAAILDASMNRYDVSPSTQLLACGTAWRVGFQAMTCTIVYISGLAGTCCRPRRQMIRSFTSIIATLTVSGSVGCS
jgi:tyrosinase